MNTLLFHAWRYLRSGAQMRSLPLVLACALLAGCDTQLLANLSERDANQVLAVLLRADIDAHKESTDTGKTWTIKVPDSRVVQSLDLLRANGLPQNRYANLGEMFKKDGLISTPVEERVRFVYGVSQELADTLSKMDGVITARVHIVMPQNDPLALTAKPSSASVFVKHRASFAVAAQTAPIKNLVAHSVEGLEYDAVSVTFVEADPPPLPLDGVSSIGNLYLWLTWALALAVAVMLWMQRAQFVQAWPPQWSVPWRSWLDQVRLKFKRKS
jgi:type III secretion protein J